MSKIIERVPLLTSVGALLTGAMLFGAASAYTYDSLTAVVYAEACGDYNCNAEDPDDCPDDCKCNDDDAECIPRIPQN